MQKLKNDARDGRGPTWDVFSTDGYFLKKFYSANEANKYMKSFRVKRDTNEKGPRVASVAG